MAAEAAPQSSASRLVKDSGWGSMWGSSLAVFDMRGGRMAWSPFCSAPCPAISGDGSKQGISYRPCLTWLLMVLQFHSAVAWDLMRILTTFKSCVGSLLYDSVGPISQVTRLESSRGTQCNFPVPLPIPLLYSRSPGWYISFIHWSPGKVSPTLPLDCGHSLGSTVCLFLLLSA